MSITLCHLCVHYCSYYFLPNSKDPGCCMLNSVPEEPVKDCKHFESALNKDD